MTAHASCAAGLFTGQEQCSAVRCGHPLCERACGAELAAAVVCLAPAQSAGISGWVINEAAAFSMLWMPAIAPVAVTGQTAMVICGAWLIVPSSRA